MFSPLLYPASLTTPEFLSGKSGWVRHIPVAFALVEALRPRVFVELGTHHGDSYFAFCQAVAALGTQTKCFAIDSWQGDEQAGHYGPEVLAKVREYHGRYADFSTLIQSEFDSARSQFGYGGIDLLHIDGFHTYEAVKHDFETWLPAVSDRGVIVFHDIRVREREFGVWRFWEELRSRYDHFEMQHAYGLGVIAVGSDLPETFRSFMAAARTTPGFDPFFNAQGLRVELSTQVAQQKTHIGELERYQTTVESRLAEVRAELERQAQQATAERQAAESQLVELRAELERQAQRAAVESQLAEVRLESERQIQRAATDARIAEVKLELERQAQQTLLEQMSRSASGWQARMDDFHRLMLQVQTTHHEAHSQQNACERELRNMGGDLGQVISHLGYLQLLAEDQGRVLDVVTHWCNSKPYRLARDIYRPLARFCNRLRGKKDKTRLSDGSASSEASRARLHDAA